MKSGPPKPTIGHFDKLSVKNEEISKRSCKDKANYLAAKIGLIKLSQLVQKVFLLYNFKSIIPAAGKGFVFQCLCIAKAAPKALACASDAAYASMEGKAADSKYI